MNSIISNLHTSIAIAEWQAADEVLNLFAGHVEAACFAIENHVGHGLDSVRANLLVYLVRQLAKTA